MPRVADLMTELESRTGRLVADAGLYLDPVQDDAGGATVARAYLRGIGVGLAAVGIATADLYPVDAEVAPLTSFAVDRVLDEAERHALRLVQLNYPRVLRAAGLAPLAPANDANNARGGHLYAEKQAVDARVAALNADLQRPYREPAGSIAVAAPAHPRPGFGLPWWREHDWGLW